ncbi:MAG: HNH endonuclease [Fimbriimonadaceae bacterium]|nr:HNH endonuclease [Fimbriimonadaceae bacterium]
MDGQVLVLNENYEPLNITNLKRAVTLLHLGKAEVVETVDRQVRSARSRAAAPSVVRLAYYVRRPYPQLRVSRKGIFARDHFRCQYCGARDLALTLDHVIPVSRSGAHDWTNLVTACVACNTKKGDRTPSEAGMTFLQAPYRPRYTPYISFPKFVTAVRDTRWHAWLNPYAGGIEAVLNGSSSVVSVAAGD